MSSSAGFGLYQRSKEDHMDEVFIARYRTHSDAAEENQRLIEEVFVELTMRHPKGMRYSVYRLADGVTFLHVASGAAEVLPELDAFQKFQLEHESRVQAPVETSLGTLIGSYQS
jgi:hypothetical protein